MRPLREWKDYWDAKAGGDPVALNDYCVDGIPLSWELYYDAVVRPNIERIELTAECDVLEIGCGSGLLLREMEGRVRHLVGTDLSATMLSHYRGSAETHVCPADSQPFAAASFDRILMVGVAMYFPDFAYFTTVVERGLALLRRGGLFLIGDMQFGGKPSRSGYLGYDKAATVTYLDRLNVPYSLLMQSRLKRTINTRHDILLCKD